MNLILCIKKGRKCHLHTLNFFEKSSFDLNDISEEESMFKLLANIFKYKLIYYPRQIRMFYFD